MKSGSSKSPIHMPPIISPLARKLLTDQERRTRAQSYMEFLEAYCEYTKVPLPTGTPFPPRSSKVLKKLIDEVETRAKSENKISSDNKAFLDVHRYGFYKKNYNRFVDEFKRIEWTERYHDAYFYNYSPKMLYNRLKELIVIHTKQPTKKLNSQSKTSKSNQK